MNQLGNTVVNILFRHFFPFLGDAMHLPQRRDIDSRLVAGSLVFGIGWGFAGFCPGPALVSFASGQAKAAAFVAAMLGGMVIYHAADRFLSDRPFYRLLRGGSPKR